MGRYDCLKRRLSQTRFVVMVVGLAVTSDWGVGGVALAAGVAMAVPEDDEVTQVHVAYRPEELRDEASLWRLAGRIEHAAAVACGDTPDRLAMLRDVPDVAACRERAVAGVVTRISSPQVRNVLAHWHP